MIGASGAGGQLRVGYQRAADLTSWSLTPVQPGVFALQAVIGDEDSFWITQQPLHVALYLGDVEWSWRDVTVVREGDEVMVRVASPPQVGRRR